MARKSHTPTGKRPPRVKLAGTVLSIILLENGRQVRGKLHQLSVTGGLLHMDEPLHEGINIELLFHVGATTVRSKAKTLFPLWATQGCLQPFEFDDLSGEERIKLENGLRTILPASASSSSSGSAKHQV